ncbi:MAG: PTS sugar transporter subunit IIA [Planctomycetota bacterium]|nr:PTS sugar transporter subunit IIA [Planctomycetota bacterium]
MPLADHLHPAAVLIAPPARDKWHLIEMLAEAMVVSGRLPADQRAAAVEALFARERCVSTGLEDGIAVPHAALEGLPGMVVALALLPEGIPFESQDDKPAQVVVGVLVPRQEKLLHLQTLAEVARRLGDREFRSELLQCSDGREAVALWSRL